PSLRVVAALPQRPQVGAALTVAEADRPAGSRRRRDLGALMLRSDVLAAATACALSAMTVIWLAARPEANLSHLAFVPLSGAAVVVALACRGAYSTSHRLSPGIADELLSLTTGSALAGLVLLAAGSVGPLAGRIPPVEVAVTVGASMVLVPAFRALALAMAAGDRSRVARVVVVGSGKVAGQLATRLARSPLVELVGTVDDDPAGGADVIGAVDDLPQLCRALDVDRVVIAFSRRHPSRSAELVLALREVVAVDVVVRYFELAGWESRLHDVAGLSLLNLGGSPGRLARAAKRGIDLAVAITGLVLLGPLMVVIALGVWAETGEPILFRQARVGRGGRLFRILKFRTMVQPGPPGTTGRTAGRPGKPTLVAAPRRRTPLDPPDPSRVTGIGQLLRRTGLDELPQLLNVLRGEMSLVGPRPFIPEECTVLLGWAHRRFDVRPGMTGMWQVCGQHEVSLDELCRLDVQYATSWSIRTDLRILARTPTRILHGSAPGR
ncbi:MAG: exopolysaccharide biosynthesis polyprenyl glycosylphosphotransferase, partial [Acidimicrobiales bacterium]